jgi:hypothetical protein
MPASPDRVQTSFILAVASSRAHAGVGIGLRRSKSGKQADGGRQRYSIQRMKILRANMEKTRISPRFSRSRASKGSQVDGLDVIDGVIE